MRVLHIIPSISPRRGGPSEVVRRLAEAQRALGLDVGIITSDEDQGEVVPGEPVLLDGIPVRFFPRSFTRWPPLRDYAICPGFAPWAQRHLRGYDLLHVHALFSHLPTTAMRLARRARVPYLSRPLGQLGRWPLRQGAWKKAAYLKMIERPNLEGAAAVHFASASEAEEAGELRLGVRSIVVPHGVAIPRLDENAAITLRDRLNLPRDQRIVLFLGRLHAKKGLDFLLRALALTPEPRPILLVAGEGPEQAPLHRLADKLGLTSAVRWLGAVDGDWKQLCLQGADLFALTSHHENFGVAVLEALAAGTPVLVSPAVALAETIDRNRLGWVAPLEPTAIAKGLQHGLHSASDAPRAARRKFVEANFGWAGSARALAEVYCAVVKSR